MKSVQQTACWHAPALLSVLALASAPCQAREPGAAALLAPAVFGALLWLLLLGWAFRALLRRHLRFGDRIAETEAQLGLERKSRALAERALAETHRSLCRLMQQQDQVREAERRRIARDIHDDLGQNLLALKIELSLLQVRTSGAYPALHEMAGCMVRNLDLSIKSLRAIINDLRPALLEDGLRSAIERQVAEFARLHGIRCMLDADPAAFSPGKEVEAPLFRILQESLSNVARHARASEVRVALACRGGQLTLTVEDNGVGMAGGAAAAGGCGLSGIRDRVSVLGGKFSLTSQAGAGTRLTLAIPVGQALATH